MVFSSIMLTKNHAKVVKDCEARGISPNDMHKPRSKHNVKVRMRPSVALQKLRIVPAPFSRISIDRRPLTQPYSPFADLRAPSSVYEANIPLAFVSPRSAIEYELPNRDAQSNQSTTTSDPFVLDKVRALDRSTSNASKQSDYQSVSRRVDQHILGDDPAATKSPHEVLQWPLPVVTINKSPSSPSVLRSAIQSPASQSHDSSYSTVDLHHDQEHDSQYDDEEAIQQRLSAIREESSILSQVPSETRTDRLLATFRLNNDQDELRSWQTAGGLTGSKVGTIDSRGSIHSAVSTVYKLQYL